MSSFEEMVAASARHRAKYPLAYLETCPTVDQMNQFHIYLEKTFSKKKNCRTKISRTVLCADYSYFRNWQATMLADFELNWNLKFENECTLESRNATFVNNRECYSGEGETYAMNGFFCDEESRRILCAYCALEPVFPGLSDHDLLEMHTREKPRCMFVMTKDEQDSPWRL
jgi:hypothetical protein